MTTDPDEIRRKIDRKFIALIVVAALIVVSITLYTNSSESTKTYTFSTLDVELTVKNLTTTTFTFNISSNYTIEISDSHNNIGYIYYISNETVENETFITYHLDMSVIDGPVHIKITNLDRNIWETYVYEKT